VCWIIFNKRKEQKGIGKKRIKKEYGVRALVAMNAESD
jgi:hypothetical protein